MAHEVDEAQSDKRILRWENGRPVYAKPSTASDDDDETDATDATTESLGHDEDNPSAE